MTLKAILLRNSMKTILVRRWAWIVLVLLCHMIDLMAAQKRVLVLAELGGQHDAFTQTGLRWLHQQAEEMNFSITELDDCNKLHAGDIAQYDLVVQLNYPPYVWSQVAMKEFEQAIDKGTVAWIGFHHASLLGEFDGYPMWLWFSDFLGSIRFQNYIAEKADGQVIVEDPGHPVMSGVNPKFLIKEDEWYTYDQTPRRHVHVLASVDENTYHPASGVKMGDHPVIWTNLSKPARNVYFQIGHSASLFDNPDFVRMFTNALLWVLNRPMKCYAEASLESEMKAQPIVASKRINGKWVLALPVSTGKRAIGPKDDPDYAIYGTSSITIPLNNHNLEDWNRISFDIRTDLDAGIANVNVAVDSHPYSGVGAHLVNVEKKVWQHVIYQIEEMPRKEVTAIRLYTDIKGRNLSKQDSIHYEIRNMQLERVAQPEQTAGWQVAPGKMAYSMSGYFTMGPKTALVAGQGGNFKLIDEQTHRVVFQGTTQVVPSTLNSQLAVIDFSDFQREGIYSLVLGDLHSAPFPISRHALDGTMWKTLNFIRCQRCGDVVDGIHARCHTDVFCDHNGQPFSYGGGWHDAGDLSQQTLQTGDVTFALLEAYQVCKQLHPQLAERLLDEAQHGLRQLMNTRMGDGWRASSIGLLHWTDGIAGTEDDIHTVRKQHHAFDNYLYAAYEAYASLLLNDEQLKQVAIEDFGFADSQFLVHGLDTFKIKMEHTYGMPESIWMAAASWSASMLYQLTGEKIYADKAAQYIHYTLMCQEQSGEMAGYFYRDSTHQSIVHFMHQSREQLPIQALVALCESQRQHQDFHHWQHALTLYGQYLKKIMKVTLPYGMIPSGIYQDQSVRRFPLWTDIFNGNEALILASGKAAALCGRFLDDQELSDIAIEQLYWTLGKNPFCQSLMYGEGHRYPSQDSFSSGEIVGEMPVGIRAIVDKDMPYFPMTNNACYKEVWLTSAGKWLSLLAELMKL